MSNLFKQALSALKGTKNLETVLAGSGFLEPGTYEFVVQAIDSSEISQNRLTVTFATPEGQLFTERGFFANKDGTSIGVLPRLLASGCIPSADAFRKLIEALDADETALEMLTGMRLQGTLKRGPGFHVHALASGGYAAFDGPDATKANKLTDAFDEIADARECAKAMGHKQSFVRLSSVKAVAAEENLAAFERALAARAAAPKVAKVAPAI